MASAMHLGGHLRDAFPHALGGGALPHLHDGGKIQGFCRAELGGPAQGFQCRRMLARGGAIGINSGTERVLRLHKFLQCLVRHLGNGVLGKITHRNSGQFLACRIADRRCLLHILVGGSPTGEDAGTCGIGLNDGKVLPVEARQAACPLHRFLCHRPYIVFGSLQILKRGVGTEASGV